VRQGTNYIGQMWEMSEVGGPWNGGGRRRLNRDFAERLVVVHRAMLLIRMIVLAERMSCLVGSGGRYIEAHD
jgi:hypothetical protein